MSSISADQPDQPKYLNIQTNWRAAPNEPNGGLLSAAWQNNTGGSGNQQIRSACDLEEIPASVLEFMRDKFVLLMG